MLSLRVWARRDDNGFCYESLATVRVVAPRLVSFKCEPYQDVLTFSCLIENMFQLVCKSFRDFVKLNKIAALEFNVGFSQVFGQGLAKLIGGTKRVLAILRQTSRRMRSGCITWA